MRADRLAERREREAIAYLIEENRLLRRQLGTRRLRLTDDDRRRLAARAYRVGRAALREIATIATPDTLLWWHRRLIARNGRTPKTRTARRVLEIRRLVVRMAEENSTWGSYEAPACQAASFMCGDDSATRRPMATENPTWGSYEAPACQAPSFMCGDWHTTAGADRR